MNESTFKTYIKTGMKKYWLQRAIESGGTGAGTPDSYFSLPGVGGWIEFKHHTAWPKRESTIIKIKNPKRFIPQRNFIWAHGKITGSTFFFIRIADDFLLFDYKGTMQLNNLTKAGMLRYSIGHWNKRVDFNELAKKLSLDYRFTPPKAKR